MSIEQLMGRYFRLQQELAVARAASPWNSRRIERLSRELAAAERELENRDAAHHSASSAMAA